MKETVRVTLEGALQRAEDSVEWDRGNVARLQDQITGYMRAQLEDEIAVADLKAALEEGES